MFPHLGVTAEEFIESGPSGESMLTRFQGKIAQLLNTKQKNVQVFTVRPVPGEPRMVDVRFAAHGSPYKRAAKLNGLVWLNKDTVSLQDCWPKIRKRSVSATCGVGAGPSFVWWSCVAPLYEAAHKEFPCYV